MEIKINNKWKVASNSKNYMLIETAIAKEGKNKGELIDKSTTYYSKIETLLEELMEKEIRDLEVTTIAELLKDIREFRVEIEKALKPLFEFKYEQKEIKEG